MKIFPASRLGQGLLKDLLGPYPGIDLLPSGGITVDNAAAFLRAGAMAVGAGSGVVPAAAVATGEWAVITARAANGALCLSPFSSPHSWSN